MARAVADQAERALLGATGFDLAALAVMHPAVDQQLAAGQALICCSAVAVPLLRSSPRC